MATADLLNIRLAYVPAKLTFLLQPLDVRGFASYKVVLKRALLAAEAADGRVLPQRWAAAVSSSLVRNFWRARLWRPSFEACGFYPDHQQLRRSAIPEAPSRTNRTRRRTSRTCCRAAEWFHITCCFIAFQAYRCLCWSNSDRWLVRDEHLVPRVDADPGCHERNNSGGKKGTAALESWRFVRWISKRAPVLRSTVLPEGCVALRFRAIKLARRSALPAGAALQQRQTIQRLYKPRQHSSEACVQPHSLLHHFTTCFCARKNSRRTCSADPVRICIACGLWTHGHLGQEHLCKQKGLQTRFFLLQ